MQNAKDAQAESVAKCLDAFKDEAVDTATGKVTAASVLALANIKREEKAPVEGSKTDKVLKWAVSFAKNVNAYSKVLNKYISNAPEIAGLVWTGCSILLQVFPFRTFVLLYTLLLDLTLTKLVSTTSTFLKSYSLPLTGLGRTSAVFSNTKRFLVNHSACSML